MSYVKNIECQVEEMNLITEVTEIIITNKEKGIFELNDICPYEKNVLKVKHE